MTLDAAARDLASITREVFAAAVRAADPAAFTRDALARALEGTIAAPSGAPHWIIALGKASPAMARAALSFATEHSIAIAGGIVVAAGDPGAIGTLDVHAGDHPVPGARSRRAADALAHFCEQVQPDDAVLLLVSGGTSSLVGAPVAEISGDAFAALNDLLLGAGLDIARMNVVRKRFARWGAGRLAAALAPATVHQILLSDVPGDDPAIIGSGPCVPDRATAADVETILREAGIARRLPLSIAATLGAVIAGGIPETPKARSSVFATVRAPVIEGNDHVLVAAEARALALGATRVVRGTPLAGDAAAAGRAIARALITADPGTCLVFGGETSVRLPASHGRGGRSQHLALAAAQEFARAAHAPVALLAAGTDGIDGGTDAAGAVVTGATWHAIAAAGIDPAAALARCDAYPALDAAGALIRTGHTGTNVADVVIAVRG